jgi:cytidylate kinase
MSRIIGLAGTNGSGKDTVGTLLASKYNYLFVSVTEILRAELRHRGLEINRENLRSLSAEWRRETGELGVLVDKAVAELNREPNKYAGVAIASLRNPGEADRVHDLGGTMVWIDADPRVRYDRIQLNANLRNRAEEDNKTFEQFLAEEEAEMNQSPDSDATALNMSEVKKRCDVFIANDTTDLNKLQADLEKSLNLNA